MMNFLRKGFFSGIFLALLVLAGFSLVLTDWTGSFRSGVASHDVARIGREKITQNEFARRVQRTLRAENVNPGQAYQMGLIQQILTTEIWQRLLGHTAQDWGVAVGDDVLLAHLRELSASAAASQNMSPAEVIKRYIASQGVSEAEFLFTLRQDMTRDLVRAVLGGSGGIVDANMMGDLARHAAQVRTLRYFVLKDDTVTTEDPDGATIEGLYENRKNEFLTPEKRDARLAILTRAQVEKSVAVTDADIESYYTAHKDELAQPEKRHVILAAFPDEAAAKSFKSALQADEKAIVAAKKKFKATSTTDDSFTKDGLPPEIADTIFTAKAGDSVGPVKTALGYHVGKVVGITPEGVPPLDSVRADLRKQIMDERLSDSQDSVIENLQKTYEAGGSFNEVIQAHHLTAISLTALTRTDKGGKEDPLTKAAGEKNRDALLAALFDGKEQGTLRAPIELPNGDIAILQVDKIVDAAPKPLADVQPQLVKDWQAKDRARKNLDRAQGILTDLQGGAFTLDEVAQKMDAHVIDLPAALRTPTSLPPGLDRPAYERFFSAEKEKPVLTTVPGGLVFGVVTKIVTPDHANVDDDLIKSITRAQSDEMMVQYLGALNDRIRVNVNQRLVDQMFAPKEGSGE